MAKYRESKAAKSEPTVAVVNTEAKETTKPAAVVAPIATSKPAVVLAELHGYKFACRIDSGADEVVISDTIIKFLGDRGIYLPTLHKTQTSSFQAVDGHTIPSQGQVQINPTLDTVAGPCKLRNITAFIMPCSSQSTTQGAACAGEIVLGNPFLLHSGLNVSDFIAENLSRLSSLDYGDLNQESAPTTIGKLGRTLLSTDNISDAQVDDPSRICNMFANGDFPSTGWG